MAMNKSLRSIPHSYSITSGPSPKVDGGSPFPIPPQCPSSPPDGLSSNQKILEEVAFYPAKPLVLQSELERLGVGNSLAVKLSSIWSQNAKRIVTAKRKVGSDLKRVDYQVLRDVKTMEQRIKLLLTDVHGHTTVVTFSPSEMFSLYEHLEGVQSSIDSICK